MCFEFLIKMKNLLKNIFRLTVSAGLLLYLFLILDLSKAIELTKEMDLVHLIIPFFLFFITYFLTIIKWKIILAKQIPVKTKDIFWIYWTANFFRIFSLGAIGSETYKALSFNKKKTALLASLLDKILSFYWYLLLGISFLIPYFFLDNSPLILISAALILLIFTLATLFFNTNRKPLIDTVPFKKIKVFLGKINFENKELSRHAAYSFLILFNSVLIYFLIFYALGVKNIFMELLIFMPILKFAIYLPISIGGLGVREYLFVQLAFFTNAMEAETALLAALMIYFLGLIYKLSGIIPFLLIKKNKV